MEVQRDECDFFVSLENLLSPVSVMAINVQNQGGQIQFFDCYCDVVEVTKTQG